MSHNDDNLLLGELTPVELATQCFNKHFKGLYSKYPQFVKNHGYPTIVSHVKKLYMSLVVSGEMSESEFVTICHERMKVFPEHLFSEQGVRSAHKTLQAKPSRNHARGQTYKKTERSRW